MKKSARGRPKGATKPAWQKTRDWLRSVKLRFEIDGIKEISEPAKPGAEERINTIAVREHRSVSAIKDRAYRPNRKKGA